MIINSSMKKSGDKHVGPTGVMFSPSVGINEGHYMILVRFIPFSFATGLQNVVHHYQGM